MPQDINREKDSDKTVSKHRAPKFRFARGDGDSFSTDRPSEQSKKSLDTSGTSSDRRDEQLADRRRPSERRTTVQRRKDPVLTEEVLSSDPRFIGRVFSVEVQDVRLPDGRRSKREVVRHPGGACVVALDDEQNLFLVRQHRVGTGDTTRELPAVNWISPKIRSNVPGESSPRRRASSLSGGIYFRATIRRPDIRTR